MTGKLKILAVVGAVLVLVLGTFAWHIWPAFSPPEHIEVGLPIGERAPIEMPLRDASGAETTLADIMGSKGAVLVMVRSADWCPFCILQLEDHAFIADELEQRGFTLASLSYDEPQELEDFSGWLTRPFPLLSDTESRFIDAMGLRDPQYEEGHYAFGVPRPTVLVLRPDGTIAAKLVSADYRQRPSNDFVLDMVDGLSE